MKIGMSSCLVGLNCTYAGKNNCVSLFKKMYEQGNIVTVCPEVLGGLSTPRDPAEIQSTDLLYVKTINGKDVTYEYVLGAKRALKIFKDAHVEVAVLKYKSPSCGSDGVYDGTFTHTLVDGQGVFAKLLSENGIMIFHENQIEEFLKYIGKEDDYGAYFKDSTSI